MYVYNLTLEYPKQYPMNRSEEERMSFDVNDKVQVGAFIQDVIEKIFTSNSVEPEQDARIRIGGIVEGMLEEDFGINFDLLPYREFVMKFVLANFKRASENHERIKKGIVELTSTRSGCA